MTLVLAFFFLLYLLFIAALLAGWSKSISQNGYVAVIREPLISVIVPVRNEAKVIAELLGDLARQSYSHFEVIIVDDHSQDATLEVINSHIKKDSRFKLFNSNGEGKKAALTLAVQESSGEIMATTDGDCRISDDWLVSLVPYFQSEKIKMVFGGVKIVGNSFFSKIQAHEFLSLIGTAASSLSLGYPILCNGANLAVRKSVFLEVGGYSGNFHIPSGDDEFLMRKIFARYPDGIKFVSKHESVVQTAGTSTFKQFVHQRIRWAGKWRHSASPISTTAALFIFSFQAAVCSLFIGIAQGWIDLSTGILLWGLKAIGELIFLKKVSLFLKVSWNWPAFVLLQFVYPFYAVFIGLLSNINSFEWKGRRLKSLTISMIKK